MPTQYTEHIYLVYTATMLIEHLLQFLGEIALSGVMNNLNKPNLRIYDYHGFQAFFKVVWFSGF